MVPRHLPDVRVQEEHDAHQLKRSLGVAYQTAWHLCHRIREAMGNDPLTGPTLVSVVEVDETMVGGKRRGPNWRDNKHWIAGTIERIPDVRKHTLHDFIDRSVADKAEAIYTRRPRPPTSASETTTRGHETVNHSAEEWVVRDGAHQQHRGCVVAVQALQSWAPSTR